MTAGDNIRYSKKDKTYVGNPDQLILEWNNNSLTLKEFSDLHQVPLNTMWDVLNNMGTIPNLKKRRIFSDEVKLKIFQMRSSGKSLKECSICFNCTESSVSQIFRNFKLEDV